MRPPLSATPPVSHVISRQFKPTPALTCRDDWRNLTTNTSIQILSLETSECHEESSFHPANVSNHLRLVDTILSPRPDDICPWSQNAYIPDTSNACVAETLVSLDSFTHHHGNTIDARIIFTPKERYTDRRSRCLESQHIPTEQNLDSSVCRQRLNRNCYSDSDLGGRDCNGNENRLASVTRSKSLSYAEYIRRKNDTGLVKPLLPCIYKSKIGGVKRLPSFRDTAKHVSVAGTRAVRQSIKPASRCETQIIRDTEKHFPTTVAHIVTNKPAIDATTEERKNGNIFSDNSKPVYEVGIHKIQAQKSKVVKFVKHGLKSVIKSTGNSAARCTISSEGMKNVPTLGRRHYRRTRYSSDIGGLSEFLRRNERRRTIAVTEAYEAEKIVDCEENYINTCLPEIGADIDESKSQLAHAEETETPRSALGCTRLHCTGTSDLQFNNCQRKLIFQSNCSSAKSNISFDPFCYAEKSTCGDNGEDSQPRRRPRLGILGSVKSVNVLPIDALEMDLVHDLKRSVERTVRCSRIKTNGSLKMKPKIQPVNKPLSPNPRRGYSLRRCRPYGPSTSCHGVRRIQQKRESIV